MDTFNKGFGRKLFGLVVVLSMTLACIALLYGSLISVHHDLAPAREPVPDAAPPADDAGVCQDPFTEEQGPLLQLDLPPGLNDPVRLAATQTVPVSVTFDNAQPSFGTGFLIKEGVVVTAGHLMDPGGFDHKDRVDVICDGKIEKAAVSVYDRRRDVLILKADCKAQELKFRTKAPRAGDRLHVAGFMFPPYIRGIRRFVVGVSPLPGTSMEVPALAPAAEGGRTRTPERKIPPLEAVNVAFLPGNSGSAVVDADGLVVGMIVISNPANRRSFYVTSKSILRVLPKKKARRRE